MLKCRTRLASSTAVASLGLFLSVAACGDNLLAPPPEGDTYREEWSAARNWNEAQLVAVRSDFARPPVHARNLFHSSAIMYDLWAVFDPTADTYFLGNVVAGYPCAFSATDRERLRSSTPDPEGDRSLAMTYAVHRLIHHRYEFAPRRSDAFDYADALFLEMGGDPDFESFDYHSGGHRERAAALGLYLARCVIEMGETDGSGELQQYENNVYEAVNEPLEPHKSGTPGMNDPNRWQPLKLLKALDKNGNEIASQPEFMTAEWGQVVPFAVPASAYQAYQRSNFDWPVCHDPGLPANLRGPGALPAEYQWNHQLVALWSAHLDPTDGVMWDISPGARGNTVELPEELVQLRDFYDTIEGGSAASGHALNPFTNAPYEPNIVPRGDVARVFAEYWGDGPGVETPPGHWFVILNQMVSDHPLTTKRYRGQGEVLSDLEWDVKAYFTLGSAMHDTAVTIWGAKGWYDSARPISAIRFMASLGQSSDDTLPSYHPEGLPLVPGRIELVEDGDALAGDGNVNVGKIKLWAWRGPAAIRASETGRAGVGWILADDWWPYQQETFVSPNFGGYISGHSTFAQAAAEILESLTGDAFFPGGMGSVLIAKDQGLRLERGPSRDIRLQWATYRDAADQSGLSRLWSGVHPPMDDVPGRRVGRVVAHDAAAAADAYFRGESAAVSLEAL